MRPVRVSFDVVLHLSGRTVADTVAALSAAFNLDTGEDVDALLETLRSRGDRRLTVLVDAVDESRDPLTIAATLRSLGAVPGVRVLVGTRQSMHEDPDHPIPRDSAILDALAGQRVIKLPRDPDAVREYVARRLKPAYTEPAAPQLMLTDDRIDDLAATIAGYEQPFLFARLAVAEIIAEPELAQNSKLLAQVLGSGHSGIFGHAVSRSVADRPRNGGAAARLNLRPRQRLPPHRRHLGHRSLRADRKPPRRPGCRESVDARRTVHHAGQRIWSQRLPTRAPHLRRVVPPKRRTMTPSASAAGDRVAERLLGHAENVAAAGAELDPYWRPYLALLTLPWAG